MALSQFSKFGGHVSNAIRMIRLRLLSIRCGDFIHSCVFFTPRTSYATDAQRLAEVKISSGIDSLSAVAAYTKFRKSVFDVRADAGDARDKYRKESFACF
jgi:hypothetical protein